MALETKRAAVNTAIDTLVTALDDLMDGLTAGDRVIFIAPNNPSTGLGGAVADAPTFSTDPKTQKRIYIHTAGVSTSNNANFWGGETEGGYFVPVWKLTNDAGEIA